ncbi:uncharacterized protein LOC135339811 [Halichondria panicea]|uniref:uncharacterized protein LOC135339811 n=1 Tax=Halichondria panicea TaxID=6063 RepID=UPI00312BA98C
MMKLFFVACLVAVCSANPPAPKVAESFCGGGEIEFHQSEKTDIGKFDICRDQVKQMEVQAAMYQDPDMFFGSLLRYDSMTSHMAYYLRGNGKDEPRCAPEMRNVTSTLPPFFDWLQFATYEGQEKVREMSYDHWGLTIADIRLELFVSPGNPNVPVYYNRKEAEDFVHYSFMSFNATAPDPKVFDIPSQCKGP